MARKPTHPLNCKLTVMITEDDERLLDRVVAKRSRDAKTRDLPLSQWIRTVLRVAAEKELTPPKSP